MRAIVQPADVTASALPELKQWLGITRNAEDDQLRGLIRASMELCEAFIGAVPIETGFEEIHPVATGWIKLDSTPVRAITSVEAVLRDGARSALDPTSYSIDISHDACGRVLIDGAGDASGFAVRLVAGIAPDWDAMPDTLKHGMIRLAAHHYLSRDTAAQPGPPASVAAMWRSWKRIRIA